jgi:hypothetical protein
MYIWLLCYLVHFMSDFSWFIAAMSKIELETSTVYFSANMYKINRNRLKQLRCFVVTAKAIVHSAIRRMVHSLS